ncbi:E3 ubiquitin-protein ligase MPSR1-like [Silene latifolia]|uniref:E3 ubiquitin-protein ligase MPSR1-like n=1 Tax=Silene latifolia TaxID=37657 RepID=UPI003D76ADD9
MELESFFNRPAETEEGKGGQPPAAKSAVEAMPRVDIRDEGDLADLGECVICLEGYKVGTTLKKMPCQHGFHERCIEKWLRLHGSCPVCRFVMPVDDVDRNRNADGDDVDSVQFDWFGYVDHFFQQ